MELPLPLAVTWISLLYWPLSFPVSSCPPTAASRITSLMSTGLRSQVSLWENPTKIKSSGSHQTVGSSWATTGCVFGPKARPRAEEPPSLLPASAPSWKGVRT